MEDECYYDVCSGVTGGRGVGGTVPPSPRLLTGKFLLTHREKRGKEKKSKMEQERTKIEKRKKGRCKIENERRKVTKWGEDLFFLFQHCYDVPRKDEIFMEAYYAVHAMQLASMWLNDNW